MVYATDQSIDQYLDQVMDKGPIQWKYAVYTKDPSYAWGHNACYKEPDACPEDQSYGMLHVQVPTSRSQVKKSLSSRKDQLYGNSTCTKSSCQKE